MIDLDTLLNDWKDNCMSEKSLKIIRISYTDEFTKNEFIN